MLVALSSAAHKNTPKTPIFRGFWKIRLTSGGGGLWYNRVMNRRIKILPLIMLLSISITNVFATELKKEQEAKHNPVSQHLSVPLFMEHRKIKEPKSYDQLFAQQRPIYKIDYEKAFDKDHLFNYHEQQRTEQNEDKKTEYFLIVLSTILCMLITFLLTNRTIRKRKKI